MLNEPKSNPARWQIEALLADASAKIGWARLRASLSKATETAAIVLAVTGLVFVVSRLMSMPRSISIGLEIAGLLVAVGIVLFAGVRASKRPDQFDDVAERLDLPANNANAIATALDLARTGDTSPFALEAIDRGLIVAQSLRFAEPSLRSRPFKWTRMLIPLFFGMILMVFGYWIRIERPGYASGAANLLPVAGVAGAIPIATNLKPPILPVNETPARELRQSGLSARASTPAGANRQGSDRTPAQASSANAAPNAAGKSAGSALASAQNSPAAGSLAAPPNPAQISPSDDGATLAMEESAGSPPGASGFDANSKSASSNVHDPNSLATESGEKSGGESESAASDNPGERAKKPGGAGAQESAGGKESKASKKNGGAGANSSQNGLNGNGKQPGGGNAPKKSRGVAPLMLGTREPDLFTGKKLAGPDERTDLQVPPQPTPESLAGAQGVTPRTGDESAVSPFIVPAEMRDVVTDYFRQFHSDDQSK